MIIAFGPWSPDVVSPTEKVAQLRSLAALSALLVGSNHPLISILRAAEDDPGAADRARELTWPPKPRGRS